MSTRTVLYPPTKETTQKWLFSVQNLHPLITVDTSTGNRSEALPPAGDLSGTGQNNLNQEITYIKVSPDGNTATITGGASGPLTLATQWAAAKFKSDGTHWYRVG